MFIKDYIGKITELEKQIGAKTKYNILEPFSVNPENSISLQEAAKRIARFIGLYGIIFIVIPTKQSDKVGGQIELKHGEKEVFIEISNDILEHKKGVLATLAHEITHKYMHINHISCRTGFVHEYESEIFTDITAVFLGLGKLMLNGSQTEIIKPEKGIDGIDYSTSTLKVGYLNLEQLAFVYRLVCVMRKIPEHNMVSNLSREAVSAIHNSYHHDYFSWEFHDKSFRDGLIEILEDDVRHLRDELEQIKQHLDVIKEKYIVNTEEFLQTKDTEIISVKDSLGDKLQTGIYDPCLIYLCNIEFSKKTDEMRGMLGQGIHDAKKIQEKLNKLSKLNQEPLMPETQKRSFFRKFSLQKRDITE